MARRCNRWNHLPRDPHASHHLVRDGLGKVADAAVVLCVEYSRRTGELLRARRIVEVAWRGGCRHPDVADAYAGLLTAAGGRADIRAGIYVAKRALRLRAGSTHTGWSRLRARRAQLEGRLASMTVRMSGTFDANGNPIPLRRHSPERPQRTRPARFKR